MVQPPNERGNRNSLRNYDIASCLAVIFVGVAWFIGAEIAYDGGSPMENQLLRFGMFATLYVPLATMYLAKVVNSGRRGAAVIAGVLSFAVLWAMIAIDVWVTHFKPGCDVCCTPASECFTTESIVALIVTALVGFSDVVVMRVLRKVKHPITGFWIARRTMRVAGTVLLTCLSCVVTFWGLYAIVRIAGWLWKMVAQ